MTGHTPGFDALIAAFTIFKKYANPQWPTHCEHDQMAVVGMPYDRMSPEDISALDHLGFAYDEDEEIFISFRYGSA